MANFIQVSFVMHDHKFGDTFINVDHIVSVFEYEGKNMITLVGAEQADEVKESVKLLMESIRAG